MAQDYVQPQFGLRGFNCPHSDCGTYAHQRWFHGIAIYPTQNVQAGFISWLQDYSVSVCDRCGHFSIWHNKKLVYPATYIAPLSVPDMPEAVKGDYNEARAILNESPRGAAALLRLTIQKLVIELGESGENLNRSIGNLVKKGLRPAIQQALDVVRVVGNNAIHPGELNVEDNPEMALSLFKLTNLIVEDMITKPREVNELFSSLPEGARDAISKRDSTD